MDKGNGDGKGDRGAVNGQCKWNWKARNAVKRVGAGGWIFEGGFFFSI